MTLLVDDLGPLAEEAVDGLVPRTDVGHLARAGGVPVGAVPVGGVP